MVDLVALGELIRDLREARKMKQDELGRRVGMSRPNISLLERGSIKFPKIEKLKAIAEALEVPPGELFARAGISQPDAELGTLAWLAEQLDVPNRRRLIEIGHALLRVQQDPPQTGGR
jgi:transcriptional regulator with XRE-family HTH domain